MGILNEKIRLIYGMSASRAIIVCLMATSLLMACNPFGGKLVQDTPEFHQKILKFVWGEPLPQSLVLVEAQSEQPTKVTYGNVYYHLTVNSNDFKRFIEQKEILISLRAMDEKKQLMTLAMERSIRDEFAQRFHINAKKTDIFFDRWLKLNGIVDDESTPTLHVYMMRVINSTIEEMRQEIGPLQGPKKY